MNYEVVLNLKGIFKNEIESILDDNHIYVNDYAKVYMSHYRFGSDYSSRLVRVRILTLGELGFNDGATISEILERAMDNHLKLCDPTVGLFLRLHEVHQEMSQNSVLSGTHEAPEGAITVLSEPLEDDIDFPRGLYLRNVDGSLWLRGYVCDDLYRFRSTDMIALEVA